MGSSYTFELGNRFIWPVVYELGLRRIEFAQALSTETENSLQFFL